jgi:hypothetical protein
MECDYTCLKSLFISVTKQSGHQQCDYKGGLLYIGILNVFFIQNNHILFTSLHFNLIFMTLLINTLLGILKLSRALS